MKAVHLTIYAAVLGGLFGCAQQPPQETAPPKPQQAVTAKPAALPARAFTSDTLYALLSAELAGSRGRLDVALANYLQQARQTQDPQVAERAYMIARYMDINEAILSSSTLWADTAPDNQDAQAAAILAQIDAGHLLEALMRTRTAHTRDNGALLQSIAANAATATDTQREVLLEHYEQLLAEQPRDIPLLISTGLLRQQQGDFDGALTLAKQARELAPNNTPALILNSGLLHQRGDNAAALDLVNKQLKIAPDNTRLRLQYARLLTFEHLEQAQQQFQQLVDTSPGDPELLRALALVAEERGDTDTAAASYQGLLDINQQTDAAHFYLATLAEQNDAPEEAIAHYRLVRSGEDFNRATTRVLTLYLQLDQPENAAEFYQQLRHDLPEQHDHLALLYSQSLLMTGDELQAVTVLNDALNEAPNNSRLLYARSMLHERLDRIDLAEADLRNILEYAPNDAAALNALGYILADRTDRYSEAYDFIKRALEQQPNDPATLDSMGWVQYRLGNLEQAQQNLEQAMQLYPDDEIAAHLGEVLWVSGQHKAALNVWRSGLEIEPQSQHILQTLQRLNIDADTPI
ncbi:tetratricopeptide repeat protein [Gilvimarinus polysaccharolyticus]|uniref:tetratricopeptide repeat protein n=1 Tax=Gilvimarinus polysaccharolyticus TaxID=863921 RepID=UPI0006738AF6|nr:tetratricopeptide repeat protein [Gilvimarinus polysaccharolyticus]